MSSDSVFTSVISTWQRFGIFDFIIPFMLVFAIVYGILERTNLFGDRGPSVNAIIALSIAMASVLTGWFVSFLTGFLPWISTIAIVVVAALMLMAIFAGNFDQLIQNDKLLKVGGILVVVVLVIIFLVILISNSGVTINLTDILTAIGLSIEDVIGIGLFVAFIVIIVVLGRTKTPGKTKKSE